MRGGLPSLQRYYRVLILLLCGLVAAAVTILSGGAIQSDGIVFDAAVFARTRLLGEASPPSPGVVVVGLDWKSLDSDELKNLPRTFLTPQWATLADILTTAGASVVAFDVIFQFSVNAFIPNYDRPFLAALSRHKKHLVLARTGGALPASPFQFAIGARSDKAALGFAELIPENDGVVRAAPTEFLDAQGGTFPGLAAAALIKMGVTPPSQPVRFLPDRPLERMIPSYSLIDVLRCAESPDLLRQVFANRVVFVGTVLPEEDRKTAPDHFLLASIRDNASQANIVQKGSGCTLATLSPSAPSSLSIPGIYVHAAVVDAILRGRNLHLPPAWVAALLAAFSALLAASAGLFLRPWQAMALISAFLVGLFGVSALLLSSRLWVPISLASASAILSMAAAYIGRYLIEDRKMRQIQSAFGHYVSPTVVRRMVETGTQPHLGGENRNVTIMFADLSGFTALSTQVAPEVLMEVTNSYLTLIVAAVEATGGYVDKFIGDAVMAIWGAPADDPNHPLNALGAACLAAHSVAAERAAAKAIGGVGFAIKIGLNSGLATVGNVGSNHRFNYTAVGDTVNLASRLEGMPGVYDCAVVISPSTALVVEAEYLLCELDQVTVKGITEPVSIYMPIAPKIQVTPEHEAFVATYQMALKSYRARDFMNAAHLWDTAAYPEQSGCNIMFGGPGSGPSVVMAARARAFLDKPPGPDWNGVWAVAKG